MFSGCTMLPDSKKTELGSSDRQAAPSAEQVKITGFSAMSCMEVCPYSYFWWCGYFQGSWLSFVTTDEFLVRDTKIVSRIGVS